MLKNRISICHSEMKQVVDRTEAAGRLSPIIRHKQLRNPAFLETEPPGMQAQQGIKAGFTASGQALGRHHSLSASLEEGAAQEEMKVALA